MSFAQGQNDGCYFIAKPLRNALAGWGDAAVAEVEEFAAPDDGVAGEAPCPEAEAEEVAQRKEIEIAEDLAVAEDADADGKRYCYAGQKDDAQEREAPECEAAGDAGHDGPGQSVSDA
jgi:hypothetical protein